MNRYFQAKEMANVMREFYDDIAAQLAAGTVPDIITVQTYRAMLDNAPNMYFALGSAAAHMAAKDKQFKADVSMEELRGMAEERLK